MLKPTIATGMGVLNNLVPPLVPYPLANGLSVHELNRLVVVLPLQ